MRERWARQIRRGCEVPNINFETGVVCSHYFAPYSIEEKSNAQKFGLYSPKNQRKLNPDHELEYHDIPYVEKVHANELTPLTNHSPTTVKTSSGIFEITETKREIMQETIEKYKQENEKLKNDQIKLKEIISIQKAQKQNLQDSLNKIDGLSTLRTWAGNFSVEPGILNKTLTDQEKLTIISYVSKRICYDKKNEQMIELLKKIIIELYDMGYNVVAVTSDMGPTNIGLWRELHISMEQTSFPHSNTSKNINVFADVPHLIKLARNHFLDKGFFLPNEKFVGINILKELLKLNSNNDLKLEYKLTQRHLMVEGASRMNVRLAIQVFSNGASELIQLLNDWFDLLNTYQKVDKNSASYGLYLQSQDKLLDKMSNFILNVRVNEKKNFLRWYILDKYSSIVFISNRNTTDGTENNLVLGEECLSVQVLSQCDLQIDDYNTATTKEYAHLISEEGAATIEDIDMNILDFFEQEVCTL
ncbi:hypothetical protein QTP88_010251 [Uroleucon formosanum]